MPNEEEIVTVDVTRYLCKVFEVNGLPNRLYGVTNLIATVRIEPDGMGYYEYFILSSRLPPHLFDGGGNCSEEKFKEYNYTDTFEDVLLHEAREDARGVLYSEFDRLRTSGELEEEIVNNVDLDTEITWFNFVHAFRAKHLDKIREIMLNTKCKRLSNMLLPRVHFDK